MYFQHGQTHYACMVFGGILTLKIKQNQKYLAKNSFFLVYFLGIVYRPDCPI